MLSATIIPLQKKKYIGTFMYFYYLLTDFILVTYEITEGLLNNIDISTAYI